MELTREDLCRFIRMVRAQKCLWKTQPGSGGASRHNDKWIEIGAQFDLSGVEAYTKFKSLRDKYFQEKQKYRRMLRRGTPLITVWEYQSHLRFLDLAPRSRGRNRPATLDTDETPEVRPEPQLTIPLGNVYTPPSSTDLSDMSSAESEGFEDTASEIRIPPPTQAYERLVSMEVAFADKAHKLLNAVSEVIGARQLVKPYDAVVEFIRDTMIMLPAEERKQFEKDLMAIVMKYRYGTVTV